MGKKLEILVLTATLTCFASTLVNAKTIDTNGEIKININDTIENISAYSKQLVNEDGFEYEINDDGTVIIVGYLGYEENKTEISIPNEIDGKSVISIGDGAFGGYSNLKEINIPKSVTSIGDDAFNGCSSLKEIKIPESVTSIGQSAFSYCSSLCEIEIPKGVISIGDGAFGGCSRLCEIKIAEKNEKYSSENGILYNKEKTQLLGWPGGKAEVTIPESVTSIGNNAFYGCSSLKEIKIPESVTSIGDCAFAACNSLSEIKIPEGVTSIGVDAFYGCSSLSEIKIPESITSIGGYAFGGCSSLSEINIPEGITSIKEWTFAGCSSLKEIKIPESVTSIEDCAFNGCSSLIIYGKKDSYAQEYANKNNIPFKLSSEYDRDVIGDDPITKYTVKFLNDDGSQIGDIQEIEKGKSAVAPTPPTKEGYTFKGWDKDFNNVTSNLEVKAIFEKNSDNIPEKPGDTPSKDENGKTEQTSDATNMTAIFTMITGLIGTIGTKKKRK